MLSLQDIAQATAGRWLVKATNPDSEVMVETDSRKDCKGSLFTAFCGENFDAHDYLQDVIKTGASGVCVQKQPSSEDLKLAEECNCAVLLVDDTVKAYQQMASFKLKKSDCQVIGITGSSGKTSVKSILTSLLETVYPGQILSTVANTNNHIGVPQNVMRLKPQHKYAILEMGTNNPGEIAVLAQCAPPDIAVITSIGDSHAGNFEEGGILYEKSDIIRYMKKDGLAIIPHVCSADIESTGAIMGRRTITFGNDPQADFSAVFTTESLFGSAVEMRKSGEVFYNGHTSLTGQHQAANLAACAAVMEILSIAADNYTGILTELELPGMRMRVDIHNDVIWVNDAYNANPQSTESLIKWLKEVNDGKPVHLILGDMLELGDQSLVQHKTIAGLIPSDWKVTAVGTYYSQAFGDNAFCFQSSAEAVDSIQPQPGEIIALKGSRGMKLELIQKRFTEEE